MPRACFLMRKVLKIRWDYASAFVSNGKLEKSCKLVKRTSAAIGVAHDHIRMGPYGPILTVVWPRPEIKLYLHGQR